MNIYVFVTDRDKNAGEYGMAVVYASNADQARQLLRNDGLDPSGLKLAKTINTVKARSQVVAKYFE